jgi:hypothetical protein
MPETCAHSRRLLRDLFAGPFPGHAIILSCSDPQMPPGLLDYPTGSEPVSQWVPWLLRDYERQIAWKEALDDDSVPHLRPATHTGVFAAAFGCEMHGFDGSNAAARPLVFTAEEADRLPLPDLDAPPIARVFELAQLLRERAGPDAPITVPDIQSPFDIAALVWNKEQMYMAMIENPDAVRRLVEKCHLLLKRFLTEFKRRFPECNLCHCPNVWTPPELGCSLSEDEVGCMSPRMFETFCLPTLTDLSETFGGLFMHCCANADRHYARFRKIPNLRGLNRVFQSPGPRPAIEAFAGETVLVMAWLDEAGFGQMLDLALPQTRYLFNPSASTLEEAKGLYARLRARCPRRCGDESIRR